MRKRGSYEQGSRYEQSGGDRTRGLVGVGRDPGGALGVQHLMGSRTTMANGAAADALCMSRAISRFETACSPN